MRIDVHVHVCATTPGHGKVSGWLRRRPNFRGLRLRLGVSLFGSDERIERDVETLLADNVNGTPELDAAVVLAFDAAHTDAGTRDDANTHLFVANDYVAELCRRHPKFRFGASVHPYRPDAVAELERCAALGAVLVKWLPPVQNIDPTDPRCVPFYDALARLRLPLLCHTGGELTLPLTTRKHCDPAELVPALDRGVTIIAAHCGTRSHPLETDFLPTFVRLVKRHPNLYGDTAALNVPTRSHAFGPLLEDPDVRAKLVHGSDWPIPSFAALRMGVGTAVRLLATEGNWLRRDVLAKRAVGFDDDDLRRAATILRLS